MAVTIKTSPIDKWQLLYMRCKFAIGPAGQHGPGFALGFIGIAKRDRRRVGTAQYRVTAMIQITHQRGFPPIPDIWPHSTNIRHGQNQQ